MDLCSLYKLSLIKHQTGLIMELFIKNISCARCSQVVHRLLTRQGLTPLTVSRYEVVIKEECIAPAKLITLRAELKEFGFELINASYSMIVRQIKEMITHLIHSGELDEELNVNFTSCITTKFKRPYPQISHIFSSIENMTIKQFIIQQKIERAKLLLKNGWTLESIAAKLSYSSAQHLSTQFKKTAGIKLVEYKRQLMSTPQLATLKNEVPDLNNMTCQISQQLILVRRPVM